MATVRLRRSWARISCQRCHRHYPRLATHSCSWLRGIIRPRIFMSPQDLQAAREWAEQSTDCAAGARTGLPTAGITAYPIRESTDE